MPAPLETWQIVIASLLFVCFVLGIVLWLRRKAEKNTGSLRFDAHRLAPRPAKIPPGSVIRWKYADHLPVVPAIGDLRMETKTGRLWTYPYVRDDRPAGSEAATGVWFAYSPQLGTRSVFTQQPRMDAKTADNGNYVKTQAGRLATGDQRRASALPSRSTTSPA
jgi:hypothetical protein